MKEINTPNREEIALVCVHTGLKPKNFKATYIDNQNGKDKSKILNVLRLGSLCAEENLTREEVLLGVELIKLMRAFNAK